MLQHEWLTSNKLPGVQDPSSESGEFKDLLPNIKTGFDARNTWKSGLCFPFLAIRMSCLGCKYLQTAFTKLKAANTFSAALDKESQEVKMEVDAAQQQAKDEHVAVSGLA